MLDRILSGKLKKIVIEIVTFIQRLFQARDIKHYWNITAVKHNKLAHSSTAWMGVSFGKQGVGRGSGKFGEYASAKILLQRISTWALSSSLHPFYCNEIVSSSTSLISVSNFLLCLCLKLMANATKTFSLFKYLCCCFEKLVFFISRVVLGQT